LFSRLTFRPFGCWIAVVLASGALLAPQTILAAPTEEDLAPGRVMAQQAIKEREMWITSDHAQHAALQQDFTSGPQVTQACLSCHNQAALQFHQTIHWTWMDPNTETSAKLGKGGLSVNNF
jgi:hypothetical protein